jgi:hypothetical protein
MSNIFKKFMKFWCAAVCAMAFCLPLYALDVQNWAAPWIRPDPAPTSNNGAFDLQLWAKGGTGYTDTAVSAHSSYVTRGPSSTLFGPSISLYFLGNKNQDPDFFKNLSFDASGAVKFFDIVPPAPDSPPSLYTQYSQMNPGTDKIYFQSEIGYFFNDELILIAGTLYSYYDFYYPDAPSFHFYDLAGEGLPGFWLGSLAYDVNTGGIPDWSNMPEQYMDQVFLFGSETTAVPEPQVYLLLGTLLGVVALAAKRKKQIA